MEKKDLVSIVGRLTRLEAAVFGARNAPKTRSAHENYAGATGGVRFLIAKGHFRRKLGLSEIRKALAKHEHFYTSQAVHEALKRLTTRGGPLIMLRERGKNLYAKRK